MRRKIDGKYIKSIINSGCNTSKQVQNVGDSISLATKDSTSKLDSFFDKLGVGSVSLNHSGTIPEGGKYVSKNGTVYTSGQEMPSPEFDDEYYYSDYKYIYSTYYYNNTHLYPGWSVKTIEKKESYTDILNTINGKPVTIMYKTFYENNKIIKAPKIPNTIQVMDQALSRCYNLDTVQNFPNNVEKMWATFSHCYKLKNIPEAIPDKVWDLNSTFHYCYELKTAPKIPSSVKRMEKTFNSCSLLEGNISIDTNYNLNKYTQCFGDTTKNIKIIGSCAEELKKGLASTGNNGNVSWE